MRTVELGRTGEQVSALALGAMLMGTSTDEATSFAMLDDFVGRGGTFVDTANCYAWWTGRDRTGDESEELLGRWFARTGRRDDVFLATKGTARVRDLSGVWPDGADEPDWELARTRFEGAGGPTVRAAVDASLRRLGTDRIDLYYVHVDDLSTPVEETLEALTDVVRAGKVRHVGWSNVRSWRLERIRQVARAHGFVEPVALQQQHSYLRPRGGLDHTSIVTAEQLQHLQHTPEVSLVAYSPILKGAYDDRTKMTTQWMWEWYEGPDSEARLAVLEEVAREVGITPNQLVLAWLLAQGDPRVVPLIGPRTREQYDAALPALDVVLEPGLVARLDAAGA